MFKHILPYFICCLLTLVPLYGCASSARYIADLTIDYQHDNNINGNHLSTAAAVYKADLIRYQALDTKSRWVNRLGATVKQQRIDNDANYWELSAATKYSYQLGNSVYSPIATGKASHRYRHYNNGWYSQSNISQFDLNIHQAITPDIDIYAGGSHSINDNIYPEFFGPGWRRIDFHENILYAGLNWQFEHIQLRLKRSYAKGSRFIQQYDGNHSLRIQAWPNSSIDTNEIGLNIPLTSLSAIDLQYRQYAASINEHKYINDHWALAYLHRFDL